jgi:pre-mRNA-processing factor 19
MGGVEAEEGGEASLTRPCACRYYMASGSEDGTVKLWDLRKLKNIQTLEIGEPVQVVAFDFSGQYLGVGAKGVKVFLAKEWSPVADFKDHADKVTAIKFGYPSTPFLASAGMDRALKVYA